MESSWRFFIIGELLLGLWALSQLLNNVPILILLIFSVINLVYALKKVRQTSFNQFQRVASAVVILLCLFNTPAFWLMIIFAVLFIGLKGVEVSGVALFSGIPWNKKKMVIVNTTESDLKNGRRFKRKWFGNTRIGSNTYEWDDINMSILSGDTIVDLGNTLLPKEDNVILIRKGLGRTRILVPTGIGIMLEHSSIAGDVVFQKKVYHLRNESIKIFSDDYDDAPRRLKIITNTLFGDIEVIRV
ncbi:cell wall-active antibiotics response protein LiaF [Vagococcus acidifermentans]|uniref:Uncharacterized protein n=1 Tax=Vagococcus acidifermentans TaxID=564710 RepID=A0A430B0G3_9ENTE|nr:cell wall-active antibiotics response protein LiaF [Vagococcus acidifermentans]RSU13731.1 hypothetical protein CBF27_02190 [Vagococcus acidifermentans]